MKDLVRRFATRAAALVMLLALAGGMIFPVGALASKQISNRYEDGEGDPIDGNDFSSGGSGGGDDFFHQDLIGIYSGGFLVLPVSRDGVRIMIVPQFDAGVFMVRFVMVKDDAIQAEAAHAQQ